MTFDELKFTARETFKAHRESEDLVIPGETDSWDALAIILNRILAEKLARAPVVYGHYENTEWHIDEDAPEGCYPKARLVCIEEVSSNSSKKD